jgi:flagellar basal body P-ring formation protein FlgA
MLVDCGKFIRYRVGPPFTLYVSFIGLLFAKGSLAQSLPLQDLSAAKAQAEEALRAHYQTHYPNARVIAAITPPDNRLRLPRCEQALDAQVNPGGRGSYRSVKLQCQAPSPWSIMLSGKLSVLEPVLTSARQLAPGQTLSEQDLQWLDANLMALGDQYSQSPESLIGLLPNRIIPAGSVLKPQWFSKAKWVARGQQVTLSHQNPLLQITTQVEALSDGGRGDVIRVKNPASQKQLDVIVTGPGRASTR